MISTGAPPPWLLLIIVVAILIPFLQFRILRPIARRAREANLSLCPRCGHPFEGIGNHACDSCGDSFDTTVALRLWRTAVLRYHRGGRSAKIDVLHRRKTLILACAIAILPVLSMLVVVSALYLYEQKHQMLPKINGYLIALPTFVLQLLSLTYSVYLGLADRRKLDRAREHNFLICSKCTFPLDAIKDAETCPECGSNFHSDDLRRRWYEAWVNRRNFREAIEMDIPLAIREETKL